VQFLSNQFFEDMATVSSTNQFVDGGRHLGTFLEKNSLMILRAEWVNELNNHLKTSLIVRKAKS